MEVSRVPDGSEMDPKILVINPGSTSDRVGCYRGEDELFSKTVHYPLDAIEAFEAEPVTAQYEMRKDLVLESLKDEDIELAELSVVIGRGGLIRPIESGTYLVEEPMLEDLRKGVMGDHPSSLGGLIAHAIATPLGIPAYIADPVVVDELDPLARYSGMPENPRISIFHALNHKAVARRAAAEMGRKYEECNFIVMHGGGGITVGAHILGRVVDVNNGLDGEGPMTPQRAGTVPAGGLLKMCFSDEYSRLQLKLMIKGQGGLVAHTGTSDLTVLEKIIHEEHLTKNERKHIVRGLTSDQAREALEAMCYQIAKEICALAAVFKGSPDAIILTGGIILNERVLNLITDRVKWLAPIKVYPGGDEMVALRDAALRVLRGEEKVKHYFGKI